MAAALPPLHAINKPHDKFARVAAPSKGRQPAGRPREAKREAIPQTVLGLAGLTDLDIAKHRQSCLHNTSVALLEEGYVSSFIEIFSLVESQKLQRELAGKDSGHYYDPLLPNEPSKLETLAKHLGLAEKLERQGKLAEVCSTLDQLAQECKQNDTWLSDHFYRKSLSTSQLIEGDEGRKLAESQKNLGLVHEFQGSLLEAIQRLEAYLKLCQRFSQEWRSEQGESLLDDACDHLRRVYTSYANSLEKRDSSSAIEYLQRAYDVIKLSSHTDLQAEACYLLGLAFRDADEFKTGLKHFKVFLEKAKHSKDNLGLIKSCEAISVTYELMGELLKAAEYQKKILEVSQQEGMEEAYTIACAALGGIYNRLGLYEESVLYFQRSSADSSAMVEIANTQFGVANAHSFLDSYLDCVLDYSAVANVGIAGFKDGHDGTIELVEGDSCEEDAN